jgi:hypothetical protein
MRLLLGHAALCSANPGYYCTGEERLSFPIGRRGDSEAREARKGGCDEYVTPAGLNLIIQVADDFGGDDP